MLARCDVVVVEVASEQGKEEGGKWEGKVEAKQRHGDRQHCAAARHDRFRPSLVDAARERRQPSEEVNRYILLRCSTLFDC